MKKMSFILAVLMICLASLGMAVPGSKSTSKPIQTTVNLDFRDVAVSDVLEVIADVGKYSLVLAPSVDKNMRVTVRLQQADPEIALRVVCDAANLQYIIAPYKPLEKLLVLITPKQTPLSVAETTLSGLLQVPSEEKRTLLNMLPTETLRSLLTARPAPFQGDRKLVDLKAEDTSLEQAAAQLAKASGYSIDVDPSVPKGIKVTARVFKMPIGDVLSMLVQQAGLTYSVSYRSGDKVQNLQSEVDAAESQLKLQEGHNSISKADAEKDIETIRSNFKSGLINKDELDAAEKNLAAFHKRLEENTARRKEALKLVQEALEKAQKEAEDGLSSPGAIPVIHIVPVPILKVTMPTPEPNLDGGVRFGEKH